jgi:hypothetical protein
LSTSDRGVVADAAEDVRDAALSDAGLEHGERLVAHRAVGDHGGREIVDGAFVLGHGGGPIAAPDRRDDRRVEAGIGGVLGVRIPLEMAGPMPGNEEHCQLDQLGRHRGAETDMLAQRLKAVGKLRTVH